MATLEQYRISDFLDWEEQKKLVLNPDFQRRTVWTSTAKVFLIDTILNGYPIPKIYLRTKIDTETREAIREVIDGQQRLRAIFDFAHDKLRLSTRSEFFSGHVYSSLDAEFKEKFLAYPLAVDQLINAGNDQVLEIFARLNSYSIPLNPPEKRHAKYQGAFKWIVRKAASRWSVLWEKYNILSVRQRVRMLDDSLMAEMFGSLLRGIQDGGQPKIDKLYKMYDQEIPNEEALIGKLDSIIQLFIDQLAEGLEGTPLLGPPHFLMLFAALAHATVGIPQGGMPDNAMPPAATGVSANALDNLLDLAAIIESEAPAKDMIAFWRASNATTHRIASRQVRFPVYHLAVSR